MSRKESWETHQIEELPYTKKMTRYQDIHDSVVIMNPNTRKVLYTEYECAMFRRYAKQYGKRAKCELGNKGHWWGYILESETKTKK